MYVVIDVDELLSDLKLYFGQLRQTNYNDYTGRV